MMKHLFLITWASIAAMSVGFEQQTRRVKSLETNSFDAYELRVLRSGKGSKSSNGKGSKSSKSTKSSKSSKSPKGSKSLSSKSPKSGKGTGSKSFSSKSPKSGKGKGSKSFSSKSPKSGKGKGSKSFSSKSPKSGKSCKSSKSQSKGSKGSLRGSDCNDVYPCTTPEEKEAAIREIVADISEFIAKESPQASALMWLLSDPHTDACNIDEVTERYALATLYFATKGDDWFDKSGWLSDLPVCTAWTGIICKDNRVEKIELCKCLDYKIIFYPHRTVSNIILLRYWTAGNNLNGILPQEFTSINTLASIDLFDNNLTGSLPAELGKLPLTFLDIEKNDLSGNLFTATFIKLADTLTTLRASKNGFSGSIPDSISEFSLLVTLWIGNNNFDGSIPESITLLKNLKSLVMKDNKFSGNIPANIGELSGLEFLLLDGNSLTGEIPEGMSKLVELQTLTLNDNELVGPIPTGFKNLKNLTSLRLFKNKLTGPIPDLTQMTELGKFIQAVYMQVGRQAVYSLRIFFIQNTDELFLNNNMLTGPLPDISNSKDITRVDLSFNSLTGEVDKSNFELDYLSLLYLDHNQLSGEIPLNFGNNANLVDLYLNDNNFTGPIPGIEGSTTLRKISK